MPSSLWKSFPYFRDVIVGNGRITPEGGYAVRMINKTGENSVKGTVVTTYNDTAIDGAVEKIIVDIPNPTGVIYEDGVADGDPVWVVVSGLAYVLFVNATARGQFARGFITDDGGIYEIGKALAENVPVPPFASDKHFYEIGHITETIGAPGLALCFLHFN